MKAVKSIILLTKKNTEWSLTLQKNDRLRVIEELVQQFVKSDEAIEVELEMIIKSVFQFKTSSQLGYLHAEIWEQFYKYYGEMGYAVENKVIQEQIRNDVKMSDDVAFYDSRLNEITQQIYKVPRSFSKASKEETSIIIERIIRLGNGLGIPFTTPEDWKKSRNIKFFTK